MSDLFQYNEDQPWLTKGLKMTRTGRTCFSQTKTTKAGPDINKVTYVDSREVRRAAEREAGQDWITVKLLST